MLLRFALALPSEAEVLEAFLLLRQADSVDADPDPIDLHAARVTEPWDGRWATWTQRPRVVEVNAPVTHVLPSTGRPVRLDVRALVQRWRRRPQEDFGVAVLAEGQSVTGVTFALAPIAAPNGRADWVLSPPDPHITAGAPERTAHLSDVIDGPELEVYVK